MRALAQQALERTLGRPEVLPDEVAGGQRYSRDFAGPP